MKTGTTYLQTTLKRNRQVLSDHGIGEGRTFGRPTVAVAGVLARPSSPDAAQPWNELAERALDSEHDTVVLSSEFLSFARPHQIEPLLRPLAGTRIEVVLTVRDQTRTIASQWQTYCRNFGEDPWPDYLRRIDPERGGDPAGKAWKTYYRAQEIDRIVRDWSAHPGVGHLHVLTPPSRAQGGRTDGLWQAFSSAARLGEVPVALPQDAINPSVGHASAQMLQDLGQHWKQSGRHIRWVRDAMRPFILEALVPRTGLESVPVLDRQGWAFAQRRNEIALEAIETAARTRDVTVHGDLGGLAARQPTGDLPERAPGVSRRQVRQAATALWREASTRSPLPTTRRPLTYPRMLASITTLVAATTDAEAEAV
jgi:hypothetical protein